MLNYLNQTPYKKINYLKKVGLSVPLNVEKVDGESVTKGIKDDSTSLSKWPHAWSKSNTSFIYMGEEVKIYQTFLVIKGFCENY